MLFAKFFRKRVVDIRKGQIVKNPFPVEEIMSGRRFAQGKELFEAVDGSYKLKFEGVYYEDGYEWFESGCCVYYQDAGSDKWEPLYTIGSKLVKPYKYEVQEFGSIENIKEFIKERNVRLRKSA